MEKSLLLSKNDLVVALDNNIPDVLKAIENGFLYFANGKVILPDKASLIFNQEKQNRINCMPAALLDEGVASVKWVSVFPDNPSVYKLPNVGGLLVLSEIERGQPIAVMDAGFLTAIRTALVDALAAKYLIKPDSKIFTALGTGEQARMHIVCFHELFPEIKEFRITGRTVEHAKNLTEQLAEVNVPAVDYGNHYKEALSGTDVVVTAISGQTPFLRAEWIDTATLYCHVGGYEDEYAVANKADKIVCDNWNALKHRGSPTIARMYQDGCLSDNDIYGNLDDLICGKLPGRERIDEFIYFNGIGLSFVDTAVAYWFYQQCISNHIGTEFDFGSQTP